VDAYVDGPVVDPLPSDHRSRWPHQVADLGPFSLVDVAATAGADRDRLALTLVNRNPDHEETVEIVLRDLAFDGAATIATVTAEAAGQARDLPDVEGVRLQEGAETPHGGTCVLTLPPKSFTVLETATTSR
jgi:hypothetical protein